MDTIRVGSEPDNQSGLAYAYAGQLDISEYDQVIFPDIRRMSHRRSARLDRFGLSGKAEHPPVGDKASSAS
jgi:hypothetical protein